VINQLLNCFEEAKQPVRVEGARNQYVKTQRRYVLSSIAQNKSMKKHENLK